MTDYEPIKFLIRSHCRREIRKLHIQKVAVCDTSEVILLHKKHVRSDSFKNNLKT